MTTTVKTSIKEFIAQRLPEYQELALDIHDHPEVSNYEFYSADALIAQLEKEGFTVEKEVAGHRTGFDARYQSGKPGPTLAFWQNMMRCPASVMPVGTISLELILYWLLVRCNLM